MNIIYTSLKLDYWNAIPGVGSHFYLYCHCARTRFARHAVSMRLVEKV